MAEGKFYVEDLQVNKIDGARSALQRYLDRVPPQAKYLSHSISQAYDGCHIHVVLLQSGGDLIPPPDEEDRTDLPDWALEAERRNIEHLLGQEDGWAVVNDQYDVSPAEFVVEHKLYDSVFDNGLKREATLFAIKEKGLKEAAEEQGMGAKELFNAYSLKWKELADLFDLYEHKRRIHHGRLAAALVISPEEMGNIDRRLKHVLRKRGLIGDQ